MFDVIGRLAFRFRWPIIVVFSILAPIAGVLSWDVLPRLQTGGFEDPGAESWTLRRTLIDELEFGSADVIALYTVKTGTVDDVEVLSAVLPSLERAKKDPDVVRVMSVWDTGATQFVSRDHSATFVVVHLRGNDQGRMDAWHRIHPLLMPEGDLVSVEFGGITPINEAMLDTIQSDLRRSELVAFPLTAILLLFIFGSVASAALPLMLGGLSVVLAFAAMRLLIVVTPVSMFAANVISIMGLGLAIDYSLFLVARFREELNARKRPDGTLPDDGIEHAIVRTVSTTGRAVAFSGVTVLASLLGLFVFPQMYLRSIAWGGVAVVGGAVGMALTILPAVLSVLGPRVDAWRIPFVRAAGVEVEDGFWSKLALQVMKHPVIVAVAVVVPLLLAAVPFRRFDPSLPDHRILAADNPTRLMHERLDREFLAHQSAAHDIAVHFAVPDALAPDHLAQVLAIHRAIQHIEGITRVDSPMSVVDVAGEERGLAELRKPRGERDAGLQAALDAMTRGGLVRFSAVPDCAFNEQRALAQIAALRALPIPPGARIDVGGPSGVLYDLKHVIRTKMPLMIGFVVTVMFVVLFLVFGSITLPIKAMIMNSLSLTASFGAVVWIFQDGRFTRLLNYTPLGISDATQPILLFAVVFGLSMDYEVLLLARVREEYDRTGDNTDSVARGLARTGRLITSAAALLVVVVASFITSGMLFMKTLGVGMALAVAIDATIIRALLVPAAMRLMGEWNWWAPAPLVRLWKRIGLGTH